LDKFVKDKDLEFKYGNKEENILDIGNKIK